MPKQGPTERTIEIEKNMMGKEKVEISMTRMLIIGGTGGTGSQFARFFKDKGLDLAVWGPSKKVNVAERLGVRFAHDVREEIKLCDIVLLSIPIERTVEVIEDLCPGMKPGSLLMDVTSLKTEPMEAMTRCAPPGVEVLGTHPMFGPTMTTIRGQTIILTPAEGRCKRWLPIIKSMLEEDGARVEILSPEEHDEMMAVVQALTHFAYIGIGSTLKALDFDVSRSRRFVSPVYDIMLDFVGRILDQSPELYASIQKNPKAARVRRVFIEECKNLCQEAESEGLDGFEEMMTAAAKHFGETHQALERSDALIKRRIGNKNKE